MEDTKEKLDEVNVKSNTVPNDNNISPKATVTNTTTNTPIIPTKPTTKENNISNDEKASKEMQQNKETIIKEKLQQEVDKFTSTISNNRFLGNVNETANTNNKKSNISISDNNVCAMCSNTDVDNVFGILICKKCQAKFATQLEYAQDYNGIPKVVYGVRLMLEGLKDLYNIDPDDDNFRDTPKRVARLMMEMNYGTNIQAAKDILNVSFPTDNKYGGLVSSNNIHVSSTCPHHLVVVDYNVSLAYVPNNGRYIGLSKLPRLARTLAKSMCLQEDYTKKLVDVLDSELKPMGCAAMVTGIHNCIQARGAEMRDVQNTTIELRGIFQYNPSLKEEWLFTIKNSAHHD